MLVKGGTGRQILKPIAEGFDAQFAQARAHCDNKPRQIGVNTIITWHLQFHLENIDILHLNYEYGSRIESRFATPIVTSRNAPNDGNCRLTMPGVKGRCARDVLLTPLISAGLNNSTTIKHIYNEFVNIIEGCDAIFDISDCWNFPWTVPVIGTENMVTRARLRYTRDYLTPGITACSS